MRSLHRKSSAPSWPFWLLLVAWICANSPQAATYAVIAWAGEARAFSHQERLSVELAHLLAGEAAPSSVAPAEHLPLSSSKPAIPTAATLKKIELAVENMVKPAVPPQLVEGSSTFPDRLAGIDRGRPPHEPPRAAVVS